MRSIVATIERVPLRVKLILILAVPAVALLAYSWVGVTGPMRTVDQMSSLGELSDLAVHISAFVHETQKERAESALFARPSTAEKSSTEESYWAPTGSD